MNHNVVKNLVPVLFALTSKALSSLSIVTNVEVFTGWDPKYIYNMTTNETCTGNYINAMMNKLK